MKRPCQIWPLPCSWRWYAGYGWSTATASTGLGPHPFRAKEVGGIGWQTGNNRSAAWVPCCWLPESVQQMLRKPVRCEKNCSVYCPDSGHGKQSHRARTWKLAALSHYHLNQPFLKSRMSPFLLQSLTKRVDAGRTRPRPKKRNIRTHGSIWENKTPVTDTHVTESDDWEALKAD